MLERRYRRTRLADDRRAWVDHERHRHQVYRKKERVYWSARICGQAKQPRQLWRSLNTLMGASDKTSLPKNCPSAQQFADFFEAKVAAVREATAGGDVTTELPPVTEVFDHFQICTASDIRSAIMGSPSKSCELDPLPTDMLKTCLPELLPFITELCNASLQQGHLPLSQRHAIVRPRLKKAGADPSDVQNYRPVSNLAFMAKIVEKLACHQMVVFFERLKLLPSMQSAYRKKHSTETAVLKVITDVLRAADRGEVSLLCMLDLSAAFDTVDHDILIERLQQSFGVQGLVLSWIESFLCDRSQAVSIAGELSSRSFLSCGVPQGSVLGPVLFLVYCADVISIARRCGLGIHSYADDSQLYFHADPTAVDNKVKQLVACIEEISHWMSANRLKLNTDKTQFIWLGTPHQLSKFVCDTITVGGIAIQVSTEAMCLGVLLDSALTFAPHVRRLSGRSFYHLRQMRIVRKSLTQDAAKTMVHAFVTSRIDYCNSILYGASAAHIRPLQNVLNAAARLILRKRKYDRITAAIRDLLHWLPVQQRIEYKMCVLVYKCLHQAAPIYLSELCIPVATFAGRSHLRSAVKECLVTSYCRTKNYGQRSFSYSGPAIWNSLPLTVRDSSMSLTQFCARLKTEMFCRAYDRS